MNIDPSLALNIFVSSLGYLRFFQERRKNLARNNLLKAKEYDCIIVGAGISGLEAARRLHEEHRVPLENIFILEATNDVGGRIKQNSDWIPGVNIELGAEFVNGNNSELKLIATSVGQSTTDTFCWAQAFGGPNEHPVYGQYALYFYGTGGGKGKLLKFNDYDEEHYHLNEALWELAEFHHEEEFNEKDSLEDYLQSFHFTPQMIQMANAGFANKLCANINQLSLKQSVQWTRNWWRQDYRKQFSFRNSFQPIIGHMKENLQIKFNAPVIKIDYPSSSGVTVATKDGATFHAKTCIISTPPHVLKTKTISFNPPLPATKLYALECTQMNTAVKVFVKFSAICWPQRLNGLVVSDPDFYFPEIWFCDVQDRSEHREDGIGYATSVLTSKYAEKLLLLPEEEIYRRFVTQLDSIFSHLQPHHFENIISSGEMKFPKPSSVFLGGMMYIWSADAHPYVGGGWSSPRAGYPIDSGNVLAESIDDLLYFCGEATHQCSGGTVTAAFESGKRAASEVSLRLAELR